MIKVLYKCHCMKADREVEVPSRPWGGDIGVWMGVVAGTVSLDHTYHAPNCCRRTMEYVKIPLSENTDGVGTQPVVN